MEERASDLWSILTVGHQTGPLLPWPGLPMAQGPYRGPGEAGFRVVERIWTLGLAGFWLFPLLAVQLWTCDLTLRVLTVKVTQSCLILCNPMDYTVHGILQARIPGLSLLQGLFPTH